MTLLYNLLNVLFVLQTLSIKGCVGGMINCKCNINVLLNLSSCIDVFTSLIDYITLLTIFQYLLTIRQ